MRIISNPAQKIILFLIMLAFVSAFQAHSSVRPHNLKCDFKVNPVGVSSLPFFGWELISDERNQVQTAYNILIADNRKDLDENTGNVWNSGKVISQESIHIQPDRLDLKAGKAYCWKVRVWDRNNMESGWSEPAEFVTALFGMADWDGAQWISREVLPDSLLLVPGIEPWGKQVSHLAKRRPVVPLFRKEFKADRAIRSAYLFISGLGHYKAYINGKQVGQDFLSPGWTHYQKTCLYNTYEVTDMMQKGENVLGVIVGNGFHNVNNERYRKVLITYGMPKIIAKLLIQYVNGTSAVIISDETWKSAPSPVTYSSIYGGEDYDARLEQQGWSSAGFDDAGWSKVLIAKSPGGVLMPETTYPVRPIEVLLPQRIDRPAPDVFVYDFGRNASGIFRIRVKGAPGDTVRLRPGELVGDDGFVTQQATGSPHYYQYVLKGGEDETWQPLFTYYGCRYLQVEGARPAGVDVGGGKPVLESVDFLHTYSSAPRSGNFYCSNPLFNNIDTLIRYAIQSNFQSVLTDCPHREKLGWLEQAYLMGGSVQFNIEVYHLFRKLVGDIMDAQHENGLAGNIAPEYVIFGGDFTDSPEWGSALVVLPWLIYRWYGDISVMEEAWPAMVSYVRYLDTKAEGHILSYGLGDWYDAGPERPGFVQLTPKASTATALYYYDYMLLSEMADLLNRKSEAITYSEKAKEIRKAYNQLLFDPNTFVYATGSQTAMAVPLSLDMVDEHYQEAVLSNLVDSVLANDRAITAGDIGFRFLIDALTKEGKSQLVYEMNNRDDVPGYGYQIRQGATALTESWQALRNVSNNHLMLGHLMEWFYTGLGGLGQEDYSGAYRRMIIKPAMVKGLEEVKTRYHTPYGWVRSEWQNALKAVIMKIEIPVNTEATVYLPSTDVSKIIEGNRYLMELPKIRILGIEQNQLKIMIGSGNYNFVIIK